MCGDSAPRWKLTHLGDDGDATDSSRTRGPPRSREKSRRRTLHFAIAYGETFPKPTLDRSFFAMRGCEFRITNGSAGGALVVVCASDIMSRCEEDL